MKVAAQIVEESWQTISHLRGYSYPELYCKKLSNQKPMANTAGTTRRTTLCWTQAEIKELLLMKLGTECKISQYTDDTTFILDGSQSSFSRSLYLLDSFGLISGLKVNYAKTEGLWIGSCKSSEITLPGLSLRAGGRRFSPATKRVAPGYFYWKIEEK